VLLNKLGILEPKELDKVEVGLLDDLFAYLFDEVEVS
jgi:hypothetical protein